MAATPGVKIDPIVQTYDTVDAVKARATELLQRGFGVRFIFEASPQGSIWQGYAASANGTWLDTEERYEIRVAGGVDVSDANPTSIFNPPPQL